jgi:hypothetical protein
VFTLDSHLNLLKSLGVRKKFPWVEFVVDIDRKVHQVKCKVCSIIDGKEKLLTP